MALNGFIRVPVTKVRRALKFAEKYSVIYEQRNDDYFNQALTKLAEPEIGKREIGRGFGLIKKSKELAYQEAREVLEFSGHRMWHAVGAIMNVPEEALKDNQADAALLRTAIDDLRVVFLAGHSLDYIQLDVPSCTQIEAIIVLANKERF